MARVVEPGESTSAMREPAVSLILRQRIAMHLPTTIRSVRPRSRAATAMLECAVTLPVLLVVLFALLDLGLAAMRYNALAESARRIAREAILHGSRTPSTLGTWGPTAFAGTAA